MLGKVVGSKMKKTIVVEVERLLPHPIYKKRVKRTKRFQVHNELDVKLGDQVEISETRPLSKTKRFVVKRVLPKTKEVKNK